MIDHQKLAAQMVYDRVVTHLMTQGKRAIDNGTCEYRTVAGLSCAVGCLFDDLPQAQAQNLGGTVRDPKIKQLLAERGYGDCEELLALLQRTHDCSPPYQWPDALRYVAVVCGLDPAVLKSFEFHTAFSGSAGAVCRPC